jgi:hypothetical protein
MKAELRTEGRNPEIRKKSETRRPNLQIAMSSERQRLNVAFWPAKLLSTG